MKTNRILHIVDSMDPQLGGVSQAVRTIIAGLSTLGVHNEVVSLDAPDADYLGSYPFPIHALGPGRRPWSYSAKLVPWLRAALTGSDRVIVHGLWLYSSYAARQAVWQGSHQPKSPIDTPIFIMPHGMLDPYFQRAASRKLKAVRNWAYWKLIERNVVNEASGLLFTCADELLLARQSFQPYRPKREINVGYGIQAAPPFTLSMRDAFRAECPGLDGPYLLFLSRINYKKGVDLLIKAYSTLVANHPAAAPLPKLVIAGPGMDTDYGQTIRQLMTNLNLPDSAVFMPGMLTGDAKWGAFYGCDAFVLPSHQENFGIAVVEALACRKPVLISDKVNIYREIEAAGAGFIGPDTEAGTLDALTRWLALPTAEQRAMAARAQETFTNQFAIGPAAERLLAAVSTPYPHQP